VSKSNAAIKPNALASNRRFPINPTLGRPINFVYRPSSVRGVAIARVSQDDRLILKVALTKWSRGAPARFDRPAWRC
jgi:hypothetical protein